MSFVNGYDSETGKWDLNYVPPRFEDEYPEEAAILAELCQERGRLRESGVKLKPLDLDVTLPITAERKPGRNEPCPCGSGKKYKKCCGKNV